MKKVKIVLVVAVLSVCYFVAQSFVTAEVLYRVYGVGNEPFQMVFGDNMVDQNENRNALMNSRTSEPMTSGANTYGPAVNDASQPEAMSHEGAEDTASTLVTPTTYEHKSEPMLPRDYPTTSANESVLDESSAELGALGSWDDLVAKVRETAEEAGFDAERAVSFLEQRSRCGEVSDALKDLDANALDWVFAEVVSSPKPSGDDGCQMRVRPLAALSAAELPETFIAHTYTRFCDDGIDESDLVLMPILASQLEDESDVYGDKAAYAYSIVK